VRGIEPPAGLLAPIGVAKRFPGEWLVRVIMEPSDGARYDTGVKK
jgi:hypothetical protein